MFELQAPADLRERRAASSCVCGQSSRSFCSKREQRPEEQREQSLDRAAATCRPLEPATDWDRMPCAAALHDVFPNSTTVHGTCSCTLQVELACFVSQTIHLVSTQHSTPPPQPCRDPDKRTASRISDTSVRRDKVDRSISHSETHCVSQQAPRETDARRC